MDNTLDKLPQNQPTTSRTDSLPLHDDVPETPVSLKSRYQFIRQIGSGAQGKIYCARNLSNQSLVAIKQLNISSIKDWKEYELFHREADVLKSLSIDGVAKFYEAIDCLEDKPPCSYIVQEYIEGSSLQKMLNDSHRFKLTEVYDIILQMLSILNNLHSHNPPIIHRDIKPSNIILTQTDSGNYRVSLIDFGAVANPQVQGGGSTIAGTFGYMPPEQLMGKPSPASDIYALGAVCVYLLGGISPAELPHKDFRLIFEPQLESLPPNLVVTLRQMLEPDETKRLSDIETLFHLFCDYNLDNYSTITVQEQTRQSKTYDERLRNVRYIGQEGNIELWQELPETQQDTDTAQLLPRTIPAAYINLLRRFNHQYGLPPEPKKIRHRIPWPTKVFFISVFIAVICITYHFLILAAIFSIIFMCLLFYVAKFNPPSIFIEEYEVEAKPKDDHKLSASDMLRFDEINKVLLYGRKTIATIVHIEYIKAYDFTYINQDKNFLYLLTTKCFAETDANPLFAITYKFNPPDDNNNDDIFHKILIHTEPETHYKIGDPIPILYYMDEKYNKVFNIFSIPYPLVLEEVESLNEIASKNCQPIKNRSGQMEYMNDNYV